VLFLLLVALGVAIAGLTAYVMTWPLVSAQLRDRHRERRPEIGPHLFAPQGFAWFLRARWRGFGDADLNFLSFPGTVAAWAITLGSAATAVLFVLRVTGVAV
jgi:hypothetical protein